MPLLSGAGNTSYLEDKAFEPVTFLSPQPYGLFFEVADDYQATDFAFDNGRDWPQLLSDKVDINFLTGRYERLFRLAGSEFFYLVPWMAVPCTKDLAGVHTLDKKDFVLKVKRLAPYRKPYPLGEPPTPPDLKLDPSHLSIAATWESNGKDTLPAVDFGDFMSANIKLSVPSGVKYAVAGEHVDIRDVTHGKTIGRLRILFLEKLVQKVFLFRLTQTAANTFSLERLPRPGALDGIPESLETEHGKIVAEANAFGFNQIGVSLELEADDVDLYAANGTPIMGMQGKVRQPYTIAGAGDLSIPATYDSWLDKFLTTDLAYVQRGQDSKRSKYQWLYIFVTPFTFSTDPFYKNVDGHSRNSYDPARRTPTTKLTADATMRLPGNVNLSAALQNDSPTLDFAERFHRYVVLVHEAAHALLVHHYFDTVPPPDPPLPLAPLTPDPTKTYQDLYAAHRWLRLFLSASDAPLITADMWTVYDACCVLIDEFEITRPGKPTWTLFDQIIESGIDIDKTVSAWIDTRVFSGEPRPAFWTSRADAVMPMAELTIWQSLNDLVKFSQYTTNNVMDYGYPPVIEDPKTKKASTDRKIVRWTRFQWELLRQTIRHLRELKLKP